MQCRVKELEKIKAGRGDRIIRRKKKGSRSAVKGLSMRCRGWEGGA